MIVSDAPSSGITYNHHSDDSRGVIYDRNMFIVQATELKSFFTFVKIIIVFAQRAVDDKNI